MYLTTQRAKDWLAQQGLPIEAPTLRRWIRNGGLPAKRFGRRLFIHTDDLQELLSKGLEI